ncbi:ATP-binding cassette domain-containing protein [Methanogenium marinum]|uniref:ATP-binding cassette domain-containing protein n=1 Tax=Methanogenium marinum TaxID=348610 RepID=A0A9Q4PXU0_9EURY|nr:ATP-binding cassette domain-containing protein [Methanogenium marinum]MDE4907513.1 ATP-binding cassette domain-containing protein [Methanogenium marinum]
MHLNADGLTLSHGEWALCADGVFGEGVHLVTGAVGSGKTTLASALAGIFEPTSGQISREGVLRFTLSMQFPEYHVTGFLVKDEIRSWHLPVGKTLKKSGLEGRENEKTLTLSRGQLKRLHLTCLLGNSWDAVILDEPFAGLDCREKKRICTAIEEGNHPLIIIFTHEQAVLPVADFIWEIEGNALVCRGSVPDAIPAWKGAPRYLTRAMEEGAHPENIRLQDATEALCRMHD